MELNAFQAWVGIEQQVGREMAGLVRDEGGRSSCEESADRTREGLSGLRGILRGLGKYDSGQQQGQEHRQRRG